MSLLRATALRSAPSGLFSRAASRAVRRTTSQPCLRIGHSRGYASAHGTVKKTSDLPWAVSAVAATGVGLYIALSPSEGSGHHGDHGDHGHHEKHEEKEEEEPAKEESKEEPQAKEKSEEKSEEPKEEEAKSESKDDDKSSEKQDSDSGSDDSSSKDEDSSVGPQVEDNKTSDTGTDPETQKGKSDPGKYANHHSILAAAKDGVDYVIVPYNGPDDVAKLHKGATKDKTDIKKREPDSKGHTKIRLDSPAGRNIGEGSSSGIDASNAQKGVSNTDTRHSSDPHADPGKSSKGEGTAETAKLKGTVQVDRPQV